MSRIARSGPIKHQLMRHAKREQALSVVDALLPVTEDSTEMADLWVAQGQIFTLNSDPLCLHQASTSIFRFEGNRGILPEH